jgi:hypothetical protein
MSFLAPWALLGLAAAGVPILLHLLRRQGEERVVSFPALRYLEDRIREHERTVRLRELLLLLLRLAAVVVAVLGAARWVLPVGGSGGVLPPADIVVVLDHGAPSGTVLDGTRLLDVQYALARSALGTLGPEDQVWLIRSTEPDAFMAAGVSASAALEILEGAERIPGVSDLPRSVLKGDAWLQTRPAGRIRRLLLVESGLTGTEGATSLLPSARTPLLRVAPAGWDDRILQRGIAEVRLQGGVTPRAGVPVEVDVRLAGAEIAQVPIRLFLDETLIGGGRSNERGLATFVLPPLDAGEHTGWIEIDPDLLRADDRWPFTLSVRPAPQVSDPPAAAGAHVLRALEVLRAGGRIARTLAPAGGSASIRTASSPDGPPGGGAHATLFLPPTDGTELPRLNAALEAVDAPWRLVAPLPTGTRRALGDPALPSVDGVEVHRGWRILPRASVRVWDGVTVLSTLEGGEPWIVEARAGLETVRLVGSPLDPGWTNLPTQVAMVPLLDRLLDPWGAQDPGALDPANHPPTPIPSPGILEPTPERPGAETADTGATPLIRMAADARWGRELLPERSGVEAGGFLPWLLLAILIAERRVAAPARPPGPPRTGIPQTGTPLTGAPRMGTPGPDPQNTPRSS